MNELNEFMEQKFEANGAVSVGVGSGSSSVTDSTYADINAISIPEEIGYLELGEAMTRLPLFKPIGWFHRTMLRWFFGITYHLYAEQ